MKLEVTSAKLTGTPGPSGWTQVHEFEPEDEEKKANRGRLLAVVATPQKEGIDDVAFGREILTRLHEEYFGSIEIVPFIALKQAVEKIAHEFSETLGQVEIAATAVVGEVVYSAAVGGGEVDLFRKGALAKILTSVGEGAISASGYPQEGDILLLGTKTFFAEIAPGVMKAALEGPSLEAAAESLAPLVHAHPETGRVGAVMAKFSQKPVLIPAATEVIKKPFKISFTFWRKLLPSRPIFVKGLPKEGESEPKKKTTFLVGAILLLLLLVSIGFGIKQNRQKKFKATYAETFGEAQRQYDEALGLIDIDAAKARELFASSQTKVNEILNREIKDEAVNEFKQQLEANEGRVMGIYREDSELYLDLSLLASGFSAKSLIFSGENLFVFDEAGKKLVRIVLATKKTQVVAGPEQLEGVLGIAAYEDTPYGLFTDGIYQLGEKKEKVIEKDWEGEVMPLAYAGNFYLIDKETSVIWRYPGVEGSFGKKQNWLAPGINLDLTRVRKAAIDGNIWLLFDSGKILKLALGSTQAFSPSGVFPDLTTIDAIYSHEDQEGFYILEKEPKRMVVLAKNGEYQAQYLNDKITEADDLVISEKDKKIILLTKDKLFSLELKHL